MGALMAGERWIASIGRLVCGLCGGFTQWRQGDDALYWMTLQADFQRIHAHDGQRIDDGAVNGEAANQPVVIKAFMSRDEMDAFAQVVESAGLRLLQVTSAGGHWVVYVSKAPSLFRDEMNPDDKKRCYRLFASDPKDLAKRLSA